MRVRHVAIAVGLLCCLAASAAAAGFKLVAHPSVAVTSLTRAEVSSAFLKKTAKWPDGTPIVPVDQGSGSAIRQSFCLAVHLKSTAMVDAYWQKEVFSGRYSPPLAKTNDAEVIAYVRGVAGAIGYVSTDSDASGLREIRID